MHLQPSFLQNNCAQIVSHSPKFPLYEELGRSTGREAAYMAGLPECCAKLGRAWLWAGRPPAG